MKVLVMNAGSSSLKCSLFGLDETGAGPAPTALWQAQADRTRKEGTTQIRIETSTGVTWEKETVTRCTTDVVDSLIQSTWKGPARVIDGPEEIDAAGHRVVHGGSRFVESVEATPDVRRTLLELAELAPVHNATQVKVMEETERVLGRRLPQFAVFDTAFHATLAPAAYTYGGPHEWLERGIRRYGFHGISYQYCSRRAAELAGGGDQFRLVACHLGRGCSMAAIRGGKSVDTTMGFTPLDGLVMGSRSGSVDPGILLHLLLRQGVSAQDLDDLLNRESGLEGLSGVSSDLRAVMEASSAGNSRARLAIDVFVHSARRFLGAMIAALGGVDAVAFTGGIGEHSPGIRAAVCEPFGYLGLKVDSERNQGATGDMLISSAGSRVIGLVVRAQENWEIARECVRLVAAQRPV